MRPLLKDRSFEETSPTSDYYLENLPLYAQSLGDELTSSNDADDHFPALDTFVPSFKQGHPREPPPLAPMVQTGPKISETTTDITTNKLVTGWYLEECKALDGLLQQIRTRILAKDLQHADTLLREFHTRCDQLALDWDHLKSYCFLNITGFSNLTQLEDCLNTTLLNQARLYEQDIKILQTPNPPTEVPACLVITAQGGGPIFKDKTLDSFTLRLLTGATKAPIQTGHVQPEVVEIHQQKIKKNNAEIENTKMFLKENGTVVFQDLKFSTGTFPHPVKLKFKVTFSVSINGRPQSQKVIESTLSNSWISLTNTVQLAVWLL